MGASSFVVVDMFVRFCSLLASSRGMGLGGGYETRNEGKSPRTHTPGTESQYGGVFGRSNDVPKKKKCHFVGCEMNDDVNRNQRALEGEKTNSM